MTSMIGRPDDPDGSSQSAQEASADNTHASSTGATPTEPPPAVERESRRPPGVSAVEADRIVGAADTHAVAELMVALIDSRENTVTQAARVLDELIARKPEMLAAHIEKLVIAVQSTMPRAVQTASLGLPPLGRTAPAKVAKHLERLIDAFDGLSDTGKDGLVRTFTSLCTASVAYQKRLVPILCRAMAGADPKVLQRWSEIVLPALKGEPHAEVRASVEGRLYSIPRPIAQKIADQLGVKLRPQAR